MFIWGMCCVLHQKKVMVVVLRDEVQLESSSLPEHMRLDIVAQTFISEAFFMFGGFFSPSGKVSICSKKNNFLKEMFWLFCVINDLGCYKLH